MEETKQFNGITVLSNYEDYRVLANTIVPPIVARLGRDGASLQ
jgi:hypothetical protein